MIYMIVTMGGVWDWEQKNQNYADVCALAEILKEEDDDDVRHNLAVYCSVTPFVIWQPIQRPHLLERVYKPMHTPH